MTSAILCVNVEWPSPGTAASAAVKVAAHGGLPRDVVIAEQLLGDGGPGRGCSLAGEFADVCERQAASFL